LSFQPRPKNSQERNPTNFREIWSFLKKFKRSKIFQQEISWKRFLANGQLKKVAPKKEQKRIGGKN
jgi:hypothetical protein